MTTLQLALDALKQVDTKAHWINDEQAIVEYKEMMELRAALKALEAAIAQEPVTDREIWDIASDYFDADAQYDGVIAFARAVLAAPQGDKS